MPPQFDVVFHHGGMFADRDKVDYVGFISEWRVDAGKWSYWDVLDVVHQIGYAEVLSMWFNDPTIPLDEGLKLLKDDNDAAETAQVGKVHGEVHIFIISPDEGDKREPENKEAEEEEVQSGRKQKQVVEENFDDGSDDETYHADTGDEESSADDITFVDSEKDSDGDGFEPIEVGRRTRMTGVDQTAESQAPIEPATVTVTERQAKKRGRPSKNQKSVEPEPYEDYDTNLNDDVEVNETGAIVLKPRGGMERGLSDSECESEELLSGVDSDDEGVLKTYPIFKLQKDMTDYKWELGTYFLSRHAFKEAIATYAIHSGRNLRWKKNDGRRVRVRCKEGCNWMAHCRKLPSEETWQLRKVVDIHKCCREARVKMLNAKWLSDRLRNSIKQNPKLKVNRFGQGHSSLLYYVGQGHSSLLYYVGQGHSSLLCNFLDKAIVASCLMHVSASFTLIVMP